MLSIRLSKVSKKIRFRALKKKTISKLQPIKTIKEINKDLINE